MREEIERVLINHGGLNLWDNKVRSSIINAVLEVVSNKNTSKSSTKNVREVPDTRKLDEVTKTSSVNNPNSSRDNLKKNKSNPRRDVPKNTNKKPVKPGSKKRIRKNKPANTEKLELMGQNIPTDNR